MKFSYCYAGGNMPAIKEFDIESTANIEKGQVVCAEGNVITETVKGAKLIGVSEETHKGTEDMLNARSNGTKIRVNVTDGVYETDAVKVTAKSGCTANAFVCDGKGLSSSCASGVLVLCEKAENSTNKDKTGTMRKITGCSVSGGNANITIENGNVPCEGDVYAVIPALGTSVVLDEDKTGYSFDNTNTDVALRCVGFDVDRAKVYVKLENTIFA